MLGGDTSRNKIKVLSEKFMKIKYSVIQKSRPQSGGCKLGIFRSFSLVFGLFP